MIRVALIPKMWYLNIEGRRFPRGEVEKQCKGEDSDLELFLSIVLGRKYAKVTRTFTYFHY